MGLLIYLIILLLLGTYAVLYLEFASMQLFLIALIFPVVMFIVLRLLRRKIYIETEIKSLLVEKEKLFGPGKIVISIMVRNSSSFLPLLKGTVFVKYNNAFSGEKGKQKLYFSVDAGQEIKKELSVEVKTVGDVAISIEKVKIYDYLSIFSSKLIKKQAGEHVLVLPPEKEIFIEADSLIGEAAAESDKYSPYKKGEDPSEIFDVREFKDGDKFQRIHWKLSFKKQTLMVKEYSLPLADNVPVFLDFSMTEAGRDREKITEVLIQGIYSISLVLLEQELPQNFIWYDKAGGTIREERVAKEEELFWVFEELFKSEVTDDAKLLAESYISWKDLKQVETGLYLTVNERSGIDGKDLCVRNLQVINLKEDFTNEVGKTDA